MNSKKTSQILLLGLFAMVFAAALSGCSTEQEADPVVIPEQSEDARSVIFDKEGVVEIREGGELVFTREGGQPERLKPSPTPQPAAPIETKGGQAEQASEPRRQAASHVPPKLTPSTVEEEKPLSNETPATLEPLPEKTAPLVPKTTYAVQVGFFGQRSNAENLRDVLTNNDWPVRLIQIEKSSGKLFYLVVVPVRGNRDRAIAAKAKIQKQHRLEGIVIRSDSLPD